MNAFFAGSRGGWRLPFAPFKSSTDAFKSSTSFAASQYASVYFTHDLASVTSDGQKYGEAVVQKCLKNKVQYLSESECEHYGGIGYVIGYNFTALHVAVSSWAHAKFRNYIIDSHFVCFVVASISISC